MLLSQDDNSTLHHICMWLPDMIARAGECPPALTSMAMHFNIFANYYFGGTTLFLWYFFIHTTVIVFKYFDKLYIDALVILTLNFHASKGLLNWFQLNQIRPLLRGKQVYRCWHLAQRTAVPGYSRTELLAWVKTRDKVTWLWMYYFFMLINW